MAKSRSTFVCQNCGAVTNRWQGRCELLPRMEQHRRGRRRAANRDPRPSRPRLRARRTVRRGPRGAAHRDGHSGIRPRDGRRLRPWLGDAARRRAGHRQIDALDTGLRGLGAARRARDLHFGRGGGGAGAACARRGSTSRTRPSNSRAPPRSRIFWPPARPASARR